MIPNTGSTVVLRFLYNSLALSVSIASFISMTHFLWCFFGGLSWGGSVDESQISLVALTGLVGLKTLQWHKLGRLNAFVSWCHG